MGRNMFGGHPGPWDRARPWTGWWGDNPPFHHPVFVLTHYPREPLKVQGRTRERLQAQGGTTFTFVTDGIGLSSSPPSRTRARTSHSPAGPAPAASISTRAWWTRWRSSLVPILLGSGERLFEGAGDDLHGLRPVRTVATAEVTHLKFARP